MYLIETRISYAIRNQINLIQVNIFSTCVMLYLTLYIIHSVTCLLSINWYLGSGNSCTRYNHYNGYQLNMIIIRLLSNQAKPN